ncbi:restriction endonuclease [Campylobacter canis]|uniref:restriction endonuclease n=1 Tax=Campylobacter canis TaxID=3378588 RepID=UPI00387E3088
MQNDMPNYPDLIEATFSALHELGGSGKNDEINKKAIEILELSDRVLDVMHTNTNMTEIDYRLAWARTLLKNFGAIDNSARSVWSISTNFTQILTIDGMEVYKKKNINQISEPSSSVSNSLDIEDNTPEEIRSWRQRLHEVLLKMNPYGFERLAQRLLRECGFSQVEITKKSGDGGIDGTGTLKINGMVTFKIAFQCKRYQGSIGSPEIRDFRGSLTTDIEKAVFITTGTFSKSAIEEAEKAGKQQIDLMDGEAFISKIAELQIGVKEVTDYLIDEDFFFNM